MPREPRCGNNGATNGKSSVMRGADCDVGRVIEVGLVQKKVGTEQAVAPGGKRQGRRIAAGNRGGRAGGGLWLKAAVATHGGLWQRRGN